MGFLKRLKHKVAAGLSIQLWGYRIKLCVDRVQGTSSLDVPGGVWSAFYLRQALFLREKYPALSRMQLSIDEKTAEYILQLFLEIIPAIDEQAHEVCIRNALHRLRLKAQDPQLLDEVTREIARSDLRSGIPDRALVLRDDDLLRGELESQLKQSDEAYGASLLGHSWPDVSRGRTLCYYFEHHRDLLRDKTILHFSPEPELRAWMLRNRAELSFSYKTSNIAGEDVDMNQDLTAMTVDEMYDVVICHRVLEHVLDDRKALAELFRIVRPGGFLQISVPQSMHQAQTREWTVPDLTHHGHVRHYGRDFAQRLTVAGFDVEEDQWLLAQSAEQLQSNGAYPLRMYTARRPAKPRSSM
jgi:hypothetical protein